MLALNPPKELELTRLDVELGIAISNSAELDELGFCRVDKPQLGLFVKPINYQGNIVCIF